jgi:hypothetical protein
MMRLKDVEITNNLKNTEFLNGEKNENKGNMKTRKYISGNLIFKTERAGAQLLMRRKD